MVCLKYLAISLTVLAAFGCRPSIVTYSDSGSAASTVVLPPPTPIEIPYICLAPDEDFDGGSGTTEDPYQICNVKHLNTFRAHVLNPEGEHAYAAGLNYKLVTDIDLEGVDFPPIGDDVSAGLAGSLDGNNKTISNWTYAVTGKDYIGFITWTYANAEIKNLNLENINVSSDGSSVGGLTGYLWTNANITNCTVTGTVSGQDSTGGLVGDVDGGIVQSSHFTGTVNASGWCVGGLAGGIGGTSSIQQSHASASVTASGDAGGLVGCANFGATLQKSWATGAISGDIELGGLLGYGTGDFLISDCFSWVDVTYSQSGTADAGGLVGVPGGLGTITRSYSSGRVTGPAEATRIGGMLGRALGCTVEDSYWDTQTSTQAASSGGTGKTTAEMQAQESFQNWDFNTVWRMPEGGGYPVLRYP